jgi:hypothetical protein
MGEHGLEVMNRRSDDRVLNAPKQYKIETNHFTI